MKMTFTCEHHHDLLINKPILSKITYETHQVDLAEIIQDFESFLRGAGFEFNGYIDIVPFDDESTSVDCQDLNHSQYYFDTERNK